MLPPSCSFFFFHVPAPTELYTLSLHDALPISAGRRGHAPVHSGRAPGGAHRLQHAPGPGVRYPGGGHGLSDGEGRSEEHTSELQSLRHLVCRLLLEKKKKKKKKTTTM